MFFWVLFLQEKYLTRKRGPRARAYYMSKYYYVVFTNRARETRAGLITIEESHFWLEALGISKFSYLSKLLENSVSIISKFQYFRS